MITPSTTSPHARTKGVVRPKWKTRGKMGEFVMLSKHELKIDHVYQRPESRARALEYAQNWSWIACGAISVALRSHEGNVEFWVMDGQHRVAASLLREDITLLPCLCFEVENVEEEAVGFLEINLHRGAPKSTDKFRAMLVAGDRDAVAIDQMIKEHSSRTVASYSAGTTISCVGVLLKLWKNNRSVLETIFPIAVVLLEGEPFHRDLVSGLFWLESAMVDGESLTTPRWFRRLKDVGFKKLRASIDETSAYLGKRTPRSAGLGMLKALNHGVRNKLVVNDQLPGDSVMI